MMFWKCRVFKQSSLAYNAILNMSGNGMRCKISYELWVISDFFWGGIVWFLFLNYAIVKWRRWRAVSTLSEAMGFRPRKVVRAFKSASGIERSNLAMHSSANELLTTFTPVKSSTTRSFCSIIGNKSSRTRLPQWACTQILSVFLKTECYHRKTCISLFGRKDTLFFWDVQEKSFFGVIFLV